MTGRPINEDRKTALALGFKTYIGMKHVKCGTTERYTSGGGCVHCARIIATEQREARKFLKLHQTEYLESLNETDRAEMFNIVVEQECRRTSELDNPEPMVLEETDDAEARARQALDDIM